MGRLSAAAMREATTERVALTWHLRHNHYPPIPINMLLVAERALQHARKGDWDGTIALPEGITHRITGNFATVRALVDHMHLDAFLDSQESEE